MSALALAALFAYFVILAAAPEPDTLPFEAAKAALQVLSIAFSGLVAGIVVFEYQQAHLRDAELSRLLDERAHEAKVRREEDLKLEEERIRDERRRQDEVLRSLLDRTISEYHTLKRERRLLRARTSDTMTVRSYDEFILSLIDIQLAFENHKRLAPLVDALVTTRPRKRDPAEDGPERGRFVSLEQAFETIEVYLNEVVKECEHSRALAAFKSDGVPLAQLVKLAAMMRRAGEGGDFVSKVSYQVDDIVDVLQAALLTPVELARDSRPSRPRRGFLPETASHRR